MRRLPVRWLIGASVAALALLGTLRLYQQPDFLLTLADQLWGCF
ncbi:MAG: hypothetical protein NWS85_03925 [Hydrogenophaga sp.]|jgi:hypothetical protein|nr:hypothetical protein [Hydrogenophaga sp.]